MSDSKYILEPFCIMENNSFMTTIVVKNNETNDKVYRKVALLGTRKVLNLCLKAGKQLRN